MADQHQQQPGSSRGGVRFGAFEFDLTGGVLWRRGRLVNLQDQQAVVLKCLVERAGQTVTREELRSLIWPDGTYVEFEFGLYNAVNRLRRLLGDSASDPHFIETIPKQGYRFIAALEYLPPENKITDNVLAMRASSEAPPAIPRLAPEPAKLAVRPFHLAAAAVVLLTAGAVIATLFWRNTHPQSSSNQVYRYSIAVPGVDQVQSLAISPSGDQIVFQGANQRLYRRYLDRSEPALIHGTEGGRSPFFSPDGQRIGFFTEHELKILEGESARSLAMLPPEYRFWVAVWGGDGFIYFNTRAGDTASFASPLRGAKPSWWLAPTMPRVAPSAFS